MIAYLFIFHIGLWYIGRSYWVRDGCSLIIFVKRVKTVFVQVLSCSTQFSADAHNRTRRGGGGGWGAAAPPPLEIFK